MKTKSIPHLPTLHPNKSRRVITKHFTNLPLYLNQNHLALFNWLIYQSTADNHIAYSGKLLKKYTESVKASADEYGISNLMVSTSAAKYSFEFLVSRGFLFNSHLKGQFVINPLFTYHPEYITGKEYKWICDAYNDIYKTAGNISADVVILSKHISKLVADKMKKKKLKVNSSYIYKGGK